MSRATLDGYVAAVGLGDWAYKDEKGNVYVRPCNVAYYHDHKKGPTRF